jgi:Na+-transporting methylmalonyl-CoA/oxaloacetate decarboxylase gamma subunit
MLPGASLGMTIVFASLGMTILFCALIGMTIFVSRFAREDSFV